MGFDLFGWLDGASPWWWIALGVALGAAEMATFTYVLLWLGLAALMTGGALWAFPGMGGGAQLLVFALSAGLATVAGRYALAARRPAESGLNRRTDGLVGRTAKALGAFEEGEGAVEIDGVRWPARLVRGEAPEGAPLVVTATEGTRLLVAPR